MSAPLALVLLACLGACPARTTPAILPTPVPDTPARLRIARLEAVRGGGLAELTELARHGSDAERSLAIRALGRLGGAQATEVLLGIVREGTDRARIAAAVSAIGLAASLDETPGDPATTQVLVGSLAVAKDELAIEGIGRAADASAQPALVALLGDAPRIARAAAIALGRYGRRKVELSDASRAALVTAGGHADPGVRYAVAWALAREQLPPDASEDRFPDVTQRLAKLAGDPEPEVRAQAISGLGRRKTVRAAAPAITSALRDADWRVAVEAVRALAGEASDDAGRDAVAGQLAGWSAQLATDPPRAQVVLEALRGLAPHAQRPAVATAIAELRIRLARTLPDGTRGWIDCLTRVIEVRAAPAPSYATVETCALPDHLRLPLLAGLIDGDVGSLAERRRALRVLLAHRDARVRGAGLGALASLWKAGDTDDRRAAVAAVSSALTSKDTILVGAATEAAGAIYELDDPTERAALDAAVVTRARNEREADLATPLFELIGKHKLATGVAACRAGLAGPPIQTKAARACLVALGEPGAPEPAVPAATAPPVDVAAVVGKSITWHLLTTRGDIVITLAPDAAPWAVAAIVALTRKGFYDGLEFHRVVPNFVAQGGDPTGSGSGGPGFALPAEPTSGPGFATGGVGIADSGRDSGGSQWFGMHARAAHLDGRYTWIGQVTAGQASLDALLIGDRVVRAVVEVTAR